MHPADYINYAGLYTWSLVMYMDIIIIIYLITGM